MQFSVVGLPHYTIWHLYEPSVDDIRHMEVGNLVLSSTTLLTLKQEMEQERKAREKEEQDKADRMKKIKDQFADANSQWEKDKTDIQNEALREKKEKEKADTSNPQEAQAPAQAPAQPKAEQKAEAKADSKVETKAEAVKAQWV